MRKTTLRCFRDSAQCHCGERQDVFFTMADFGDAMGLHTCKGCGVILAVNPEIESYRGPPWKELRRSLACPECGRILADAAPYPFFFRCRSCGQMDRHSRWDPRYPPLDTEVDVEIWDPYHE